MKFCPIFRGSDINSEDPEVLETLQKLYPAIICKKFHPGKARSLFSVTAIFLCPVFGGSSTKIFKFPLLKACQLFGMSAIGRFHCSSHFRSSHRRCSIKKVLLKISQNSQENACARVSFLNKVPSLKPATLLKTDFGNSIIKRLIIYEKLICPMEWFRQREKCNCY